MEDRCEEAALRNGWTFRGPVPKNFDEYTWWLCPEDHLVEATLRDAQKGLICETCAEPSWLEKLIHWIL